MFLQKKKCGWDITHTTGFHSSWNSSNKENNHLKRPSTHLIWEKLGETPTKYSTKAANINMDKNLSSLTGTLSGTVDTSTLFQRINLSLPTAE